MAERIVQEESLVAVADAIRAKGGTSDLLSFPTGFADAIAAIQAGGGGGGGSEEEWIGDGNTHIWITLAEGRTSPMLGCCPNGTVTVDWGDGTTPDTLTGTSVTSVKWTPTHHYAAAGDYVITLTVDGKMEFYGTNASNQYSGILRCSSSSDARNAFYRTAVKKIECGDSVTTLGNNAFYACHGLESIKIPASVTSIGANVFIQCYSLASITIPDSVTSIGASLFSECYSLASITIPAGVTSIGRNTFYCCYSLAKMRFKSATPPTVASSNAFTNIPTDCVIIVPVGSLAAYTSATNYPSSSTYTYIEED